MAFLVVQRCRESECKIGSRSQVEGHKNSIIIHLANVATFTARPIMCLAGVMQLRVMKFIDFKFQYIRRTPHALHVERGHRRGCSHRQLGRGALEIQGFCGFLSENHHIWLTGWLHSCLSCSPSGGSYSEKIKEELRSRDFRVETLERSVYRFTVHGTNRKSKRKGVQKVETECLRGIYA